MGLSGSVTSSKYSSNGTRLIVNEFSGLMHGARTVSLVTATALTKACMGGLDERPMSGFWVTALPTHTRPLSKCFKKQQRETRSQNLSKSALSNTKISLTSFFRFLLITNCQQRLILENKPTRIHECIGQIVLVVRQNFV